MRVLEGTLSWIDEHLAVGTLRLRQKAPLLNYHV